LAKPGLVARAGPDGIGFEGRDHARLDESAADLGAAPLRSVLRVIVGLLFLEHGTAKLFDFPHQQTH
jgi:hypothetical protein